MISDPSAENKCFWNTQPQVAQLYHSYNICNITKEIWYSKWSTSNKLDKRNEWWELMAHCIIEK